MYASIQLFFHTFHSFRYLLDHIWSWQFFERIFRLWRANVRFSWVFYFVFICSGYISNLPHYIMGGIPRPVFIRGFPDFLKSRFSSRILVCWIQWGRERRIILKRFVTVVAWKFLKISCFFSFCRSVVGTSDLTPSATSGPLILQVLRKIWESCSLISPNLNLQYHFLASI